MRLIDADELDITTITTDDYSGNEILDVILKEDIDDALTVFELTSNTTNGDMIKAMFPNTESRFDEKTGIMLVKWVDGTTKTFKASWWNAPYKKEIEE